MSQLYNSFGFLAPVVAFLLKYIHEGLGHVFPSGSGWAWGLSIVFLTMSVRILLFPLFVKQIKSQRRMQELAPQVKALQTKHKGDRETLNTELMKLYKDNNTNPVSGCLPLIFQMPVFIALFRVMNEFKPKSDGTFKAPYGLSQHLIGEGAKAKIFGSPLAASFKSSSKLLTQLDGNATTVKIVCAVMIIVMGSTTFYTQRQLMARNGAPADAQQAQIQKTMLYILPLFFAVAGINFPVGVLLYWLTTNVWSMGQQRYVIKRMPPVVPGGGTSLTKSAAASSSPTLDEPAKAGLMARLLGGTSPASTASSPAAASGSAPADQNPAPSDAATPAPRPTGTPVAATAGAKPGGPRPATGRAAGSRKNKNRKGGRR